ncbi:unnamed protein product [Candidula unifasciata]|uniref:Carbonic anhydrase n=1 Tax=Candidula unifasciata TaxID=100452 RepID=A0A8S3ZEC8_9EUPU|nr:unnamed protein product [Candidula unifasciata]
MRVRGGGLGQVYRTVEFHFHWGSTDDLGSEHAVNGRKYPLEMHIVNYAEKYGNVKAAMTQPDGLAVLGVFFEISDKDNPQFTNVDEALRHVHKAGQHATINQLRLRSLLPDDLSRFWRYNGSLTTPFCFESVTWTLFSEPQKISKSQLETLRSLLHEEGHDLADHGGHHTAPSKLLDNWRPLQPLNGRVVKQSFHGDFMSSKPYLDTKMTPFDTAVPVTATSGRHEGSAVTIMYNINPNVQPTAGQETAKLSGMSQGGDRMQSQIIELNNFNSQQSFGTEPKEEKLLIYNQGSPGVINSAPTMLSSEKSQRGDVNGAMGLADGQMLQTSHGMEANSGPEASMNLQGKSGQQTSSSTTPDLHKNVGLTQHNSPMSSSSGTAISGLRLRSSLGDKDVSRNFQVYQSLTSGKVSSVINTSTPTPTARLSTFPVRVQGSETHTPIQNLPLSQSLRSQSLASSGGTTNPQANHVSHSSLRNGQIDSRIAHGMAQQANIHHQMPPVVRHVQPISPTALNQDSNLHSQRQRHNSLQQQAPHLHRPPTSQQLRAIFERLAATNRANSRLRMLSSGAAAIPRLKTQQMNSASGTSIINSPPSSEHQAPVSKDNQLRRDPNLQPRTSSTSMQSTLISPNTNTDYNGAIISSHSSPQTHWQQLYQQQANTHQNGYRQGIPQQLNRQQQLYPQQSPFQQQGRPPRQYFLPSIYSPASGVDNTNLYYAADPGISGPGSSIMSVPQVFPVNNAQQGNANSQLQSVGLVRPGYEQGNNWQSLSFQNQQYPFLVY